jgi:calcium-dependent protein kinase
VHRDLKPENLLLDKDTENPRIKIIDFGTSQMFDPEKKMNKKFGTPYYIAPEVLNRSYNEKCDVWSCGVIIYILLCGYPPFNGANDKQIIDSVLRGKFTLDEPEWDEVSEEAKDLVRKLLTLDVDKRITAEDAVQHAWFKKYATQEKIDKTLASKTMSNLKNFRGGLKLKNATMTFIASQLVNKEETEHLEKVFRAIDANGDG